MIEDGSGNTIETKLNVNNVRIIEKDNQTENLKTTDLNYKICIISNKNTNDRYS